jgi:hypothetical protein
VSAYSSCNLEALNSVQLDVGLKGAVVSNSDNYSLIYYVNDDTVPISTVNRYNHGIVENNTLATLVGPTSLTGREVYFQVNYHSGVTAINTSPVAFSFSSAASGWPAKPPTNDYSYPSTCDADGIGGTAPATNTKIVVCQYFAGAWRKAWGTPPSWDTNPCGHAQ